MYRMFAFVGLFLLTSLPAAFGQEQATKPNRETEARVLEFPADRSMGTLRIAPKPVGQYKPSYWFAWGEQFKELGLARGKVTIPKDHVIQLEVSASACEDLSPLGDLPADGIDAIYFRSGRINGIEHLGKLTGLKSLYLRGCAIKDADMAKLANLKDLEFLICSVYGYQDKGFGLTNESAKVIGTFKKLRYLGLRSNPMTDEGFSHLEGCSEMEILSLDGTKVTGKGLPSLYMFPKLEILSFGAYEDGASIDDAGLDVLSDMKQLKNLSLNGTEVSDAGMEHVAKLTNLESLSIDFTNVTSSGLESLEPLKKLKSIRFQGRRGNDELDDTAAIALSKLPSLERITGKWNVTDAGFEELVKLKKLKTISFDCHITDKDLERIAEMESLEYIGISGGEMSKAGIAALSELKNLERISIWNFRFKGDCFDGFKQLKSLVHMGIELEGPISKANWESLGQMSHVESVQLDGDFEFDEAAFQAIGQLKSLNNLDVRDGKAVDARFLKAISKLPKLENVSFWISKIEDGDFAGLITMPKLRYLNFSGQITDAQLMELAGHSTLSMFQNHSKKLSKGGIDKFLKATPAMKDFKHPLTR